MPPHRPLAAALLLLAPAVPCLAQISGRYQARPSGVLACGGFGGGCEVMQLDSSLDLEVIALPFPESPPLARIIGSNLSLRPVSPTSGSASGGQAFPPPASLQLEDLVGAQQGDRWLFVEPPGASKDVALELVPTTDQESLLLRGTYAEGCCDRFAFELGGVLFDWTGPGPPPALRLSGRFNVEVTWYDFAGGTGFGTPVKFDVRSGRFWFFHADNPELVVKFIDACAPFGRWWFFAAGLTNVGVELWVTDLGLIQEKIYTNPIGQPFQPVLDTAGFPCLP